MMTQEDYLNLLYSLEEGKKMITVNGAEILVKNCQDREEGCLDPRVDRMHHMTKERYEAEREDLDENIWMNESYLFPDITKADPIDFHGIPVGTMRFTMGWNNIDITKEELAAEDREINGLHGTIPFQLIRPVSEQEKRCCLIFIHGGGFIGGAPVVVENPCRAIAERANAVVLNVDYRLAPEHPYPQGFDDCWEVLKWTYSHAGELGIDPSRIAMAGDSAGGNLTAVCAMKDRDMGTHMLAYEALIYPTVSRMLGSEENGFVWSIDAYDNKKQDQTICDSLTWMQEAAGPLEAVYIQDQGSTRDAYVSPLLAKDFHHLPRTLIVTAEYDYLRLECEAYTKQLAEACVPVRHVRYGGVDHAFLDKCGYYPQAEDCINEIVKDLSEL